MSENYICIDCGLTFDHPHRYIERHGLDSPPYEEFSVCPYCGGDYEELRFCETCGEVIPAGWPYPDCPGCCED